MSSLFNPTRNPSGSNIIEDQNNIYLLRTILYTYSDVTTRKNYDENGYLKSGLQQGVDDEIAQIYTGFRYIPSLKKSVDILGTPATLICPDTNVILAGMIYLRDTNEQHKGAILKSEDIETYFQELDANYQKNPKVKSPVWLGCPSMVYSYKNRAILQEKLRDYDFRVVLVLFAPTSAATTNWIVLADRDVFNKSNSESRKSIEDAEKAIEEAGEDEIEKTERALQIAKTEAETTFANLTPNEIAGCQSLYSKKFTYMSRAEKIELFKLSIDNLEFKSATGSAQDGFGNTEHFQKNQNF